MPQINNIKFISIQIINGALIVGVSVFLAVVLSITENMFFDYNDQSEFKFIAPIILIIGFFAGSFLYKKQVQIINTEDNLQKKLRRYLTGTIIRTALLEAAALIGVIGTFTTANYYYLIFTGIALLIMIVNFPNKDKFSQELNLNFEEKNKLNSL